MEIMPGYKHTTPNPPPPKKKHTGMWILLVFIPLCLVAALGAWVYFSKPDLPFLAQLFATPTPEGRVYENTTAGIRLIYPLDWQVSETGDSRLGYAITFASSAEILASPTRASESGAVLMVGTLNLPSLPFNINSDAMGDTLNLIVNLIFSDASEGENLRLFKMSGFPAASAVFTVSASFINPTAVYLTVVNRTDAVVMFTAFCSQSEWTQQQPVFDKILNSVTLSTP